MAPSLFRSDPIRKLSSYRSSLPWRVFDGAATWADRRYGWDWLPLPASLMVLIGLRNELRRNNLHDTDTLPTGDLPPLGPPPADVNLRRADGTYNDLDDPRMGMAGARFGRNIPLDRMLPVTRGRSSWTQPARGQPPAADPRPVPAGDRRQRARRGVAAVHDPRLVQPRAGRHRHRWSTSRCRRRPLAGRSRC